MAFFALFPLFLFFSIALLALRLCLKPDTAGYGLGPGKH